MTKSHTTVSV